MESIKNKKCTIEGCEGKHVARGLCNKHYHEYKQQKKIETLCMWLRSAYLIYLQTWAPY